MSQSTSSKSDILINIYIGYGYDFEYQIAAVSVTELHNNPDYEYNKILNIYNFPRNCVYV